MSSQARSQHSALTPSWLTATSHLTRVPSARTLSVKIASAGTSCRSCLARRLQRSNLALDGNANAATPGWEHSASEPALPSPSSPRGRNGGVDRICAIDRHAAVGRMRLQGGYASQLHWWRHGPCCESAYLAATITNSRSPALACDHGRGMRCRCTPDSIFY